MQDLLENHPFPEPGEGRRPRRKAFSDGGSGEAKRAAELAAKLSGGIAHPRLADSAQGVVEVRDATRPISACEMALIRLAYAAERPPTDKLVKICVIILQRHAHLLPLPPREGRTTARMGEGDIRGTSLRLFPRVLPPPLSARWKILSLIRASRVRNCASIWSTMSIWCIWKQGRIEIRPKCGARRGTLANDLQQRIAQRTGERWTVSIASQGRRAHALPNRNRRPRRRGSRPVAASAGADGGAPFWTAFPAR